jgi:hypothetical protein
MKLQITLQIDQIQIVPATQGMARWSLSEWLVRASIKKCASSYVPMTSMNFVCYVPITCHD